MGWDLDGDVEGVDREGVYVRVGEGGDVACGGGSYLLVLVFGWDWRHSWFRDIQNA